MPLELGMRDLQVFLAHRGSLPVDSVPIVATMDIPQVIDLGMNNIGGDLPTDGSWAHVPRRCLPLMSAAPTAASPITLTTTWPGSSTTDTSPDFRWACTPSATERSNKFFLGGSGSTRHWIHGSAGISGPEGTGSSTSRWPPKGRSSGPRCSGLAVSVQPAFDRFGGGREAYTRWPRHGTRREDEPVQIVARSRDRSGRGSDTPVTPLDPMLAIAALEDTMIRNNDSRGSHRSGSIRSAARDWHIRKRRRACWVRGCTRTSPRSRPIPSKSPMSSGCVPS